MLDSMCPAFQVSGDSPFFASLVSYSIILALYSQEKLSPTFTSILSNIVMSHLLVMWVV